MWNYICKACKTSFLNKSSYQDWKLDLCFSLATRTSVSRSVNWPLDSLFSHKVQFSAVLMDNLWRGGDFRLILNLIESRNTCYFDNEREEKILTTAREEAFRGKKREDGEREFIFSTRRSRRRVTLSPMRWLWSCLSCFTEPLGRFMYDSLRTPRVLRIALMAVARGNLIKFTVL